VSKHTTCDDDDGGEVKRRVEVPVCRCRRRDVDVGAVLLGTNKARKNRNPNTHVNVQKFEAKRTHKCCQNLCQDNAGFLCQRGLMDVQRGNMVLKWVKMVSKRGINMEPADVHRLLPGWAGYFRSELRRCGCEHGCGSRRIGAGADCCLCVARRVGQQAQTRCAEQGWCGLARGGVGRGQWPGACWPMRCLGGQAM
jgi:hypothetical protein